MLQIYCTSKMKNKNYILNGKSVDAAIVTVKVQSVVVLARAKHKNKHYE